MYDSNPNVKSEEFRAFLTKLLKQNPPTKEDLEDEDIDIDIDSDEDDDEDNKDGDYQP